MQHIETQVIKIDPQQPEKEVIQQAASLIQQGQLVVFPTETVYGLGADALQTQALEGIFAAKARPFSDPLIVHIADYSELAQLVTHIPQAAIQLAEAFWPGPLTLILPASAKVPKIVTAGLPSVAVRMPRHSVAQALIRVAGTPIAAPSANRFMHVSPTNAQHVYADLGGRVPLILDGGPSNVGVESTVLDLCAEVPTILRPGGVSLEALRRILPEVRPPRPRKRHEAFQPEEEIAQAAPGQMLVHYSPNVPTFLFEGTTEAMRKAMLAEIERRHGLDEQVGVLIGDEDIGIFQKSGAVTYALGTTDEQIATRLFAGLRVLEEARVDVILCRSFAEQGLGLAIKDRLTKAAGGKVITCE